MFGGKPIIKGLLAFFLNGKSGILNPQNFAQGLKKDLLKFRVFPGGENGGFIPSLKFFP